MPESTLHPQLSVVAAQPHEPFTLGTLQSLASLPNVQLHQLEPIADGVLSHLELVRESFGLEAYGGQFDHLPAQFLRI